MAIQYLRITAQASNYDCGAYGAGNYNEGSCQASTGGSTAGGGGSNGGGFLADTGYGVIIPVALAVAILAASIVYAVRQQIRRRRSPQA